MLNRVQYSWVYVGVVLVLYAGSLFLPGGGPFEAEYKLADPAKSTLDYLLEVSKMAVTLNSAMFSAAAALAIKGKDWSTQWDRVEGFCVVIALLCGAISYYGVYMGYIATLEMAYAGSVSPFQARLDAALTLQYHGTLLGVFFLGLVFTRMLEGRAAPESSAR